MEKKSRSDSIIVINELKTFIEFCAIFFRVEEETVCLEWSSLKIRSSRLPIPHSGEACNPCECAHACISQRSRACICECAFACIFECARVCICECVHAYVSAGMQLCVSACMHVCVSACIHVYVRACMHVYVSVGMHVCVKACIYV